MRKKTKLEAVSVTVVFVFFLFSVPAFAQSNFPLNDNQMLAVYQRSQIVRAALDQYEGSLLRESSVPELPPDTYVADHPVNSLVRYVDQSSLYASRKTNARYDESTRVRSAVIELTLEYMFSVRGEQIFEVIDSNEHKISKLKYPLRGQMFSYGGEMRLSPDLAIGARYANSYFKKVTSTDTDWFPDVSADVWNESNSKCRAGVELFDINLYLRIFNLNAEQMKKDRSIKNLLQSLVVKVKPGDTLTGDVFLGYQYAKGNYRNTDLVDTVEWWTPTHVPIPGEDSTYTISYQGPRLGGRTEWSGEKYSFRFSFAYAWLKTKATGWWNLREYAFDQSGAGGSAFDIKTEVAYKITSRVSCSLGYNFWAFRQKKMKESGSQPGLVYTDLDIIRNADCTIYGPFAKVRVIW